MSGVWKRIHRRAWAHLPHPYSNWCEELCECEECGKTFLKKGDPTKHALTHTGVRNYECEECGKTFLKKGDPTRHALTYTGVSNYVSVRNVGKQHTTNGIALDNIAGQTMPASARRLDC